MVETQVLEHPAEASTKKITLVDCDIHPMAASIDELDPGDGIDARIDQTRLTGL